MAPACRGRPHVENLEIYSLATWAKSSSTGVSRPKMLTRTFSLSWSSLISEIVPLKSANGTFLDPHGLALFVLQAGTCLGGRLARLALRLDLQDAFHFFARQWCGSGAQADEAGHTRRVAHHVPRVVIELHAGHQIAREDLLGHDLLLAVFELDDVLDGDDDLEDALFHVHGDHATLQVGLHLVFVARVGVDHEPVAGPVVGALDGRVGGLVEHIGGRVLAAIGRVGSNGVSSIGVGIGLGGVVRHARYLKR